ncbi:MAG TPA: galactokinase family protein [Puia sp.]|nr:galactokinase family protein [Puia sp.]
MNFEEAVIALRKDDEKYFSSSVPVYISRAPGRLDLMGGNDDYTGGLVFESTIREGTYAAAQLSNDDHVVLKNKSALQKNWKHEITFSFHDLTNEVHVRALVNESPEVRWTAYVLGNIFYLKKKFPEKINKGVKIYIDSAVPPNRGVSSSAAIEVAVMKAAAAAYNVNLSGIELALACQWVENTIAESACGIMDQAAVVTGKEGFIMPLVCQPCNPEPLIQLPEELKIWGIDSGVSHQVSGIEYEAARAAAFMGYKIICDHENIPVTLDTTAEIHRYIDAAWNGYLANVPVSLFQEKYEALLPKNMDNQSYLAKHQIHVDPFTPLREKVVYHVWANTKYAVEENHRVQTFSELSRSAALTASKRAYMLMGELMYQSHYAYTECGLGAKATDYLVNLCRKEGIANGIYGAKITGGGAGGTVAILADKNAGEVIQKIFKTYSESGFGDPYIFEGSSDGADSYGIKVI